MVVMLKITTTTTTVVINNNTGHNTEAVCLNALQLVSGQAVGTLFDLEESQYMQERMEAERHTQGTLLPLMSHPSVGLGPSYFSKLLASRFLSRCLSVRCVCGCLIIRWADIIRTVAMLCSASPVVCSDTQST